MVQDSDDLPASVRGDNMQHLDEDLDREAYLHQESDAEYSDEDVMIEKDLDNWI